MNGIATPEEVIGKIKKAAELLKAQGEEALKVLRDPSSEFTWKDTYIFDFVINARTCTYWLSIGDGETMLRVALERGRAFRAAGADCVFIPGSMDEETVGRLVRGIDGPVNIILNPGYHDFEGLERLGVRRLSVGSGPARSTYNHLIEVASDLRRGEVSAMLNHPFTYAGANAYFGE